jgi:hypothetical protein
MKVSTTNSPKIILSRGVGGGVTPTSTGFISYVDIFYVDSLFINTVTLTHTPKSKSENVVVNGTILSPGLSEDYVLAGKIITFARTDFYIDTKITVFYNY